jgi:hypothetical protein
MVVVRALIDSGSVVGAVVVTVALVAAGLIRLLIHSGPRLLEALNEHVAVRRALRAKNKADREQACRVLEILRASRPPASPPPAGIDPPPDGADVK